MFSASIYAMSLVHMLAIDLHASLGTHFPSQIAGRSFISEYYHISSDPTEVLVSQE